MSQPLFDGDELFGDATADLQADVEAAISRAREEVPETDAVVSPAGDDIAASLEPVQATADSDGLEDALEEARTVLVLR